MSDKKPKDDFIPTSYDIPEGMTGEEFLRSAITKNDIYKWIEGKGEGAGDPETANVINQIMTHYGNVIDIIRATIKTPEDVENLSNALKTTSGPPSVDKIAELLEKKYAESS
jgi:hypothetical protein